MSNSKQPIPYEYSAYVPANFHQFLQPLGWDHDAVQQGDQDTEPTPPPPKRARTTNTLQSTAPTSLPPLQHQAQESESPPLVIIEPIDVDMIPDDLPPDQDLFSQEDEPFENGCCYTTAPPCQQTSQCPEPLAANTVLPESTIRTTVWPEHISCTTQVSSNQTAVSTEQYRDVLDTPQSTLR